MYKKLVRPLLFSVDPETAHEWVSWGGKVFHCSVLQRVVRSYLGCYDEALQVALVGEESQPVAKKLIFSNPVGLAAGFDKLGHSVPFFSALGFGFIEIGTVTPLAQSGNPRPRIFRFPQHEALVNRMGFPSQGMDAMLKQLSYIKDSRCYGNSHYVSNGNVSNDCAIGVNIGKNKDTPIEKASDDYQILVDRLHNLVDYIVINVSSPNTPDLRKLQSPEHLSILVEKIASVNLTDKPVFLKIAPDLTDEELLEVIMFVKSSTIAGVIATNTTLDKTLVPEAKEVTGGLSGAPLFSKSLQIVRKVYKLLEGRKPIIGVGGIRSGHEAELMIRAGASSVQVYTGLIYEGPTLIKRINQHLLKVLDRQGISSIRNLVGRDNA